MEETSKVIIVVVSAVIVSIIGLAVKGLLGACLGFILTLFVFKLFSIWNNYKGE
jgi:hypothetical protein